MQLRLTLDPQEVLGYLTDQQKEQLPFAISKALNAVSRVAVKAEQDHIQSHYRIRRDWVLRGIQTLKWSTKRDLVVIVGVSKDRDFLNWSEQGTSNRTPLHSLYHWIPNEQVLGSGVIGKGNKLSPANLHFDAQGQGPNRTFLAHTAKGPLVMQRTSSNKAKGVSQRIKGGGASKAGGVRLVWTLVKRWKVPARLQFVTVVTTTVNREWPEIMRSAMADATRTAK